MTFLTTGDLRKLIGIPTNTISNWCTWKVVEPISGGNGTGNQRQWSLMQAVGFIVAQQVRESEHGCVLSYVGSTVAAFGNVEESWLIEQLARGRKNFVRPHAGKPLLVNDPKGWGQTDVEKAYLKVVVFAKQKTKNPAPALAGSSAGQRKQPNA